MVRQKVEVLSNEMKQGLAERGIHDLREWYFNQAAISQYLQAKARGQNGGNVPAGGAPQGPRSAANSVPVRPGMPSMPPNMNNSFGGNVQQIMNLQQNAMKQEEAGHPVVPATQRNQQLMNFPPGMQQTSNAQNTTRLGQQGQNPFTSQSGSTPIMSGLPNGTRTQQASKVLVGGSNVANGTGPIPLQANSAMSNLNRAVENTMQRPASQNTNPMSKAGSQTPVTGPAQMGTQMPQSSPFNGNPQQANPHAQMQRLLNSLPEQLRRQFFETPPERRKDFLAQLQRRIQAQGAPRNGAMGPSGPVGPAADGVSQPQTSATPTTRMQTPQIPQATTPGASNRVQNMPNVSAPGNSAGTPASQSSQQQPPGSQEALNLSRLNQAPPVPLTQDEMRFMDHTKYPRPLLNSKLMETPQGIPTWGALKAWVMQNRQKLPASLLNKLTTLQTMQFRHNVNIQQHYQRMQGSSMPPAAATPSPASANRSMPMGGAPAAPTAPMGTVRPGQNQPASMANAPRPGAMMTTQVSPEEIRGMRNRFQQLENASDERVRQVCLNYRETVRTQQAQRMGQANNLNGTFQQHQPRPANQAPGGRLPAGTQQSGTPDQTARSGFSQIPDAVAPTQPKQIPAPNAANLRGTKRNHASEAVPATQSFSVQSQKATPSVQPPSTAANQGPRDTSMPGLPQVSQAPAPQQVPVKPGGRASESAPPNGVAREISPHVKARFDQIYAEVNRTYPARALVPVDQPTKDHAANMLRSVAPMMRRSYQMLLHYYAEVSNDESRMKPLIGLQVGLVRQYRDQSLNSLNDHFTMTVQEIDNSSKVIRDCFKHVQQKIATASASSAPSTASDDAAQIDGPARPPTRPTQQAQPPAQSLQQPPPPPPPQQKQQLQPPQKQPQKNHNRSEREPPPAPTSDKPPFSLFAPPPHGVPTYIRPNDLTPNKLHLPTKRRKLDQPNAATPPPAQSSKPTPPPVRQDFQFKCKVVGCDGAKQGFATADALAKHEQIHREKEPKDPLAFALEQAKQGLGLDEEGKLVVKEGGAKMEKSMSAQSMKPSLSNQGSTPAKLEGGTPMSRATTSQRSHPGNAPQDTMASKSAQAQLAKSGHLKPDAAGPGLSDSLSSSPWSNASMTPADLSAMFPTLADLHGAFGSTTLTPASTLSGGKSEKGTPKEVGSDDAFCKINDDQDDWLPPSFFGDVKHFGVDASFANDDVLGMDWETVFPPDQPAPTKGGKKDKQPRYTVENPRFDNTLFSYDD